MNPAMKILLANKDGPGCLYCGGLLDMKTGQWVAARPMEKDHYSFHLPQIIFPARNKPKKWKDLTR
jgi:phage/plasmid-associated DNA primase